MKRSIVGVDLAKHSIQVCIYTNQRVRSNKEMTPDEFMQWLVQSKPAMIVFETCSTANYWQQVAVSTGHQARQVSAKLVSAVRQNQKTDKNDALAIVQASLLPDIKFVAGKTVAQQQIKSIIRLRKLSIKQKTALSNQLKGLLLEFNIKCRNTEGSLREMIESTLEDAENHFPDALRVSLKTAWKQYLLLVEVVATHTRQLEKLTMQTADSRKLTDLEGIGAINAASLYCALACGEEGVYSNGREASAVIGLTPLQHSTGGKAKIGSIGRHVKNQLLRSNLITGAMAVVKAVLNHEPKTKKELWLRQLAERRGKKCAAVALANKNVRTAYAMLKNGTTYEAEPLPAS